MTKQDPALYLVSQIKHCEQLATDALGLTEENLLSRAGTAAFKTLQSLYADVHSIAVFCGGGNNAGDAYVLARLAHQAGFTVVIYAYKPIETLPTAAYLAAMQALTSGVPLASLDDGLDSDVELLIDGLLGVGLHDTVREPFVQAINVINDSGLPVLSLDVPSGLDANTGQVLGVCVHASVTVTFIARKPGFFTLDGPDHCGHIVCHSLQLKSYLSTIKPAAYQLQASLFEGLLPPRKKQSHKKMYGHVLVVGGGLGMPGAAYLAATAALRVGAGLVTVATRPEYANGLLPLLPEAMIVGITNASDLLPLLSKVTVCVIGPGLGESEWATALFSTIVAAQLPLVIDASALHLLADNAQHDDNWILTPHPGEAAHLLHCSLSDVQADRRKSARLIQQQYGGRVVLKGAGSIVNTGELTDYVCTAGNPGMATAGMGDVLSGVIGGLLAQGVSLTHAVTLGVWVHATAADQAVEKQGERGLLASDVMAYLRRQMNTLL